jgi:hypothetical protein
MGETALLQSIRLYAGFAELFAAVSFLLQYVAAVLITPNVIEVDLHLETRTAERNPHCGKIPHSGEEPHCGEKPALRRRAHT